MQSIYDLRAVRVSELGARAAVLRHRGYAPPPEGIVVFRFVAREAA